MGAKAFLKPTKGKIAAFIVLLAIVAIYTIYAMPCTTTWYGERAPLNTVTKALNKTNANVTITNPGYVWGPRESSAPCGLLPPEPVVAFFWPFGITVLFLTQFGALTSGVEFMDVVFRVFILVLGVALNGLYLYAIAALVAKLLGKTKRATQTPR